MEDRNEQLNDKLLVFSRELNQYVKGFYERAIAIRDLLNNEDEESVFQIGEILNQRELIIKSYNKTAEQYQRELSLADNIYVTSKADLSQQLQILDRERKELFELIGDIETENGKKISELYLINKDNVKKIEEGKRLVNAYQGSHPLADGVFFDKRK